jgi:prepilin-type N-terminal cleavage/methylation domain-containing protein
MRSQSTTGDSDAGFSLTEVLIAVVLMGLVVVPTMSLLIGTIKATALDRDHANAHAWLQTAADMLYARELDRCDPNSSVPIATQRLAIMDSYETTVRETQNPSGWAAKNIEVVDLEFWHIIKAADDSLEEDWVTDRCTTDLQKVELRVRADDGRIVEEVEVIIGGD